jgi:hypothetical protein
MFSRLRWASLFCGVFILISMLAAPRAMAYNYMGALSPNIVAAGSPDVTVTAAGAGLSGVSLVAFNNTPLTVISQTDTEIKFTIPTSLLTANNSNYVYFYDTVHGSTYGVYFLIYQTTASIWGINPDSATIGDPDTTITVDGSYFTSNSTVLWNGSALTTTYISSSQLTAVIPASNFSAPGINDVTVNDPQNGNSSPAPFVVNNTIPTTTSLSPASATVGDSDFTLTINGAGFNSTSVAQWNGSGRVTTCVSPTQLTCAISTADVAAAGVAVITVSNSGTGGGVSAPALSFVIGNPVPTTASVTPNTLHIGDSATVITITGDHFVSGAVVNFNGNALVTTYVSATQLTAIVGASALTIAAPAAVTVTNPAPGGGTSTPALSISIENPVPTTSTLSPATVSAGSPAITLTVNGSRFVSGSVVLWNGQSLTTRLISGARLTAVIPADKFALPGIADVTVVNPLPGGGTSSPALTVTITNALPSITTIYPSAINVGASDTSVTVVGANFNATSKVQWDGADLVTTFVAGNKLTAIIPAANLATAKTAAITVVNPGAAGGTSAPATFTVNNYGPIQTSLSPGSALFQSPGFTLTVNGSRFVPQSVVQWNGVALATTYVSATSLTAEVSANNLGVAGPATVTVFSPAPGGGSSNRLMFQVLTQPALSNIKLSPTRKVAGGETFDLTIYGMGFTPQTGVTFAGHPLSITARTQYILHVEVPADLFAKAGLTSITISNPGVASASLGFRIDPLLVLGPGLKMVSAPYDYPGGGLYPDILGMINGGTGVLTPITSLRVTTWNSLTGQNDTLAPTDGLRLGVGYWARTAFPMGGIGALSLITKGIPADTTHSFNITLRKGWNMIGDPFTVAIPLARLGVIYGSDPTPHSIAYAAKAKALNAKLQTYNQSVSNDYLILDSANPALLLEPGVGYMINAYQDCTLVVPTPYTPLP